MKELMDSQSRVDAEIDNKWIPTAGSYFVNFWPTLGLFGENYLLKLPLLYIVLILMIQSYYNVLGSFLLWVRVLGHC